MAAGWSSFVATGPLSSWAENGSQRIVDRGRLDVRNFRPPWIGA
jgi:hypothetical protein